MRIALCVFTACLSAAAAEPAFEVASVKPNRSAEHGSSTYCCERYSAKNESVRAMILTAYSLRPPQLIGGPGWISSDGWDVEARPEAVPNRSKEADAIGRRMLQSLLAERFHLVMHRETRVLPTYVLMVAKGGAKLSASAADAPNSTSRGPDRLRGTRVTTEALSRMITELVGRPVTDETGLTGQYDIELKFAQLGREDPDQPDLFTVLQRQAGLRLESRKAPVEVYVIDSVERAEDN